MLTFEKTIKQTRLLNPLKNFKEDTLTLEYRADPLAGRNTTVLRGMRDYIRRFMVSDKALINALVTVYNVIFALKHVQLTRCIGDMAKSGSQRTCAYTVVHAF